MIVLGKEGDEALQPVFGIHRHMDVSSGDLGGIIGGHRRRLAADSSDIAGIGAFGAGPDRRFIPLDGDPYHAGASGYWSALTGPSAFQA